MIDPRNVVAFLDVTGRWDPKLAGVMVGAIVVHATLLRLLGWRPTPASQNTAPGARRSMRAGYDPGLGNLRCRLGTVGLLPGPRRGRAEASAPGMPVLFVGALLAGGLVADAIHDRG